MDGLKIKLSFFSITLLLTLCKTCYAQNYLAKPRYMYENIIKNDVAKLKKQNVNYILVYQTNLLLLGIDHDINNIRSNNLVTFIIYKESKRITASIYIDSMLVKSQCIINHNPFVFKELRYLRVVKSENQLHFIPPFVNLVNNEFLLFNIPQEEFYFELGAFATYMPNKYRQKCRDEYAKVLKKNLINCIGSLSVN